MRNVTYIYFDLKYLSHEVVDGDAKNFDIDIIKKELPTYYTQTYKKYGYMINNTPFMDMNLFSVIYSP